MSVQIVLVVKIIFRNEQVVYSCGGVRLKPAVLLALGRVATLFFDIMNALLRPHPTSGMCFRGHGRYYDSMARERAVCV